MTVGFVYHLDAASPGVQSGRPHSILTQLRNSGVPLQELFPLEQTGKFQRKLWKALTRVGGHEYLLDRDETLLRSFAGQISAQLDKSSPDFLFSPSTLPLSYLETGLPITFCADAPFCAMVNYYSSFTRLTAQQLALSETLEHRVLTNSALAIYPTAWAADSAVRHYGIAPEKVAVIPFGANLGRQNTRAQVSRWIERRAKGTNLRLLFVGKEWARKGGDLVVETARWLQERGIKVRVDLVGCELPERYRNLDFLHSHGALSPHRLGQREQLTALFRGAHFLFVPSRAEAYGMVFCEANAFGLPTISTATGGIPGIIHSGSNGHTLPLEAGPAEYGEILLGAFNSRERYASMALRAYDEFEQRLNWKTFCRDFLTRASGAISLRAGEHNFLPAISTAPALELDDPKDADDVDESSTSPETSLHIAFIATKYFDPTDVGAWSGLPFYLFRALERRGVQISIIRLHDRERLALRWVKFLAYRFFRRRYLRDRDPALLRSYARQIRTELQGLDVDFIFSPGTPPIAFADTEIPIAFWVDASFAGMADFYGSFTRIAAVSQREGQAADQAALGRSSLAIYSSDWAAETARANYDVDPARIHAVPFGANLDHAPTEQEVAEIIRGRERRVCRLLFIGVEWERKGASRAVAAARQLEAMGVPARLTIIGCRPPRHEKLPANIDVLGFVSKGSAEGRALIERHFRESHFFLLPTRAEAYGLVFCEAHAFGLPCLATRIGGIPTIIEDGVTGRLFSPEADGAAYAQTIARIWSDPKRYETMALNAHRAFRERLNWHTAATRVVALMRDFQRQNQPMQMAEAQ